ENCGDTSHKSYDCPIHIIEDEGESSVKGKKRNKMDKNVEKRANSNDTLSKERGSPSKKRLKKSPSSSSTSGFVSSSVYQPQNTPNAPAKHDSPEMQQFHGIT